SSGTVTATNAANTISTQTGTALNVASTNIGAGHLIFKSISANGGTNGIVLTATGTAGGLHVLGNGSTAQGGDASGGMIQSTTGTGISLNDTTGLQLNDIKVTNT